MSEFESQNENISRTKESKPQSQRIPLQELQRCIDPELVDQRHKGNPFYLGSLAQEIFSLQQSQELLFHPERRFLRTNPSLNVKMRGILVDWLATVHLHFNQLPETLFLCINLLDRYLNKAEVTKRNLQLVGITCLFIASKCEEIYYPKLSDFVFITDKAYASFQIIQMERQILKTLEYNVTFPSSYFFYKRYAVLSCFNLEEEYFGQYLLENTLPDYEMIKYKPSMLAAAAVLLVIKISRKSRWNLQKQTGYSETQIKGCCKDMLILAQTEGKLKGIRNKFTSAKFKKVALIKLC